VGREPLAVEADAEVGGEEAARATHQDLAEAVVQLAVHLAQLLGVAVVLVDGHQDLVQLVGHLPLRNLNSQH